MIIRAGTWVRRGLLVLVAAAGLAEAPASAQYNTGPIAGPGSALPDAAPQGGFGDVIMANARWIVVQNRQGQQYPIALENVSQFLVRWPMPPDALTPNSLIEAIGMDNRSNTIVTDHVDVYEGPAQSLVTPGLRQLLGDRDRQVTAIDPTYGRTVNGFDVGEQYSMYSWAFPVAPGNQSGTGRLYAVGTFAGLNPLRLRLPDNNLASVLPASGNFSMWQVTQGSSSMVKKGDIAMIVPMKYTPRSLVLSKMVIFKKIPLKQFVP